MLSGLDSCYPIFKKKIVELFVRVEFGTIDETTDFSSKDEERNGLLC